MRRTRRLLRGVVCGRRRGLRAAIARRLAGLVRRRAPDAGGSPADPSPAEVSLPPEFEAVVRVEELPPGSLIEVVVGGRALALANVAGTFYAVSDICPHAGGALGDGLLEGTTLTCPLHGWTFDVRDGRCHVDPGSPLETYEVRVVGDRVCVAVPPVRNTAGA